MRLLDTLIKKRDAHLAMVGKFNDLIALMQGDQDFAKHTHDHKLAVMDKALAQHVASNGNGNGHAPRKHQKTGALRKKWTAAARKKQGAIMKKRWKTNRAKLLAGLHKNAAGRVARNAALKAERAATT